MSVVLVSTAVNSVRAATASPSRSVAEAPQSAPTREPGVGRWVPDLDIVSITGKKSRLSNLKPAPAVVIAFVSTSCPLSKRFAPTLAALEKDYGRRGVRFVFVDPIATDSVRDITEAVRVHGFTGPITRDDQGQIRAALGARSTTEVFVLDAARTLVYRGAVDDQYGLAYSLAAPRQRYLADVLDAVLTGVAPRVGTTTAPGCALEVASSKTAPAISATYHSRISRLIQQNCLECHRSGGVAPFALETYAEVASHAGMIRKVVADGLMPPWFAAPTHGAASPWANDRTLPAEDKRDLLAWLAGGKTEGNPADAPLPRVFPKEWEIGKPDAIVQIPEPLAVQATGKMPYRNVFVETKFAEDRWVRAIEVRPTAREVVHHVLVFVTPPDKLEQARKGKGGDEGGGFFAVYVPGNNVVNFPEGFAKLIPAGAALHFQIHYTPNGTATQDQTRVGLIFSKAPPRHEVRVAAVAAELSIPPGASNYVVRGAIPVPFDAKLLSFMPHMHVRGKAYRYELELPDKERRTLLEVPRYDFNWQLQYRLAVPVDAPAGSQLLGTAWYDNSTNNPANPDPTHLVKWGAQTDEEMMLGYFDYYVPSLTPSVKEPSLLEMALRDGGLVFNHLDKNHDGKITIDESPTPEAFREADTNGDGVVTREEFKVYWQRKQAEKKP